MFTALVTFLVTVTMILGGAGSPVQVILDSLPIDIASTFEAQPDKGGEPVQDGQAKGPEARTGQAEEFEPVGAPAPEPLPEPDPFWPVDSDGDDGVDDVWPDPAPLPEPKLKFGEDGNAYRYENAPEPEPVEAPEEAALVDDPPPVEDELPGNRPPDAGTGNPDKIVPEPLPEPDPQPEPMPAPEPASKDCDLDECPAPDPQPEPDPDPEPVLGESPGGPNEPANEPAPEPNCEDCPVPEPGQPDTDGGEDNGPEDSGSEGSGNEDVENGKP